MESSIDSKLNRRYAILGTGAVGGYYGACLQKAGLDVHFLLHRDYEYVSKHGLVIESPNGDFTLSQVNAYNNVAQMPRCDVVVVALKTTQNYLLPQLLPAVIKDDGVVLVLQNGLGIEDQVADIVEQTVIGGMCFLCSNKVGAGHIRHLDYGEITLGEYAPGYQVCGITKQMRQIADDFECAGIGIRLAEDLFLARWRKLVWNIPYNGLSVVLDAMTDELMADVHAQALVEQLMCEVVAAAAKCVKRSYPEGNRIIPDDFIQEMLDHTAKMKPYRTSMKIDYDEGRSLEIEAIFGNPLRLAQAAGAELPQISMLYQQLKFLNNKICR